MRTITLDITPVAAPRMTRRTAYSKKRYWAYREELAALWSNAHDGDPPPLPGIVNLTFYLPMPKSWSKAEKKRMVGTPHQTKQRNDIDNLTKGVFDGLCAHDGHIYDTHQRKYWAHEGRIVIEYDDS